MALQVSAPGRFVNATTIQTRDQPSAYCASLAGDRLLESTLLAMLIVASVVEFTCGELRQQRCPAALGRLSHVGALRRHAAIGRRGARLPG